VPEYDLTVRFTAADDGQARRIGDAIADTCAVEYGTRNRTTVPVNGDLRDRLGKALMAAFDKTAIVCDHTQVIQFAPLADVALAVLAEQSGGALYDRILADLADQVSADEYSPDSAATVAYNAMLPALAGLDIALKDARALLADASKHLSALCHVAHDHMGANLSCAACNIVRRIEALEAVDAR
jgi:hypothetical protein